MAGSPAIFVILLLCSSAYVCCLMPSCYVGRFAPSPSGPLHFGSLIAALSSYLDAKAHQGTWLVRIEDVDPPRVQPGATDAILRTLEQHALHWDGDVMYQRERFDAYQAVLDSLKDKHLAYPCDCNRQRLTRLGGIYDGHCLRHPPAPDAIVAYRMKLASSPEAPCDNERYFVDLFQGEQHQSLLAAGDQILKRRDGFYAYQLAVVVDDIAQGVTHIVRGADLLEVTARQQRLFTLLGSTPPAFGHVPLAMQANGQKLSKQNQAPAVDDTTASTNLWRALQFLGQNPPHLLANAPPADLRDWAIAHWRRDKVKGLQHLYTPSPIN